ncbi:MAG: HesA/MoeB/ThiF family protein [Ignavibacteriaceae bacterium]
MSDGRMYGRSIHGWKRESFSKIIVVGDEINYWHSTSYSNEFCTTLESQKQLFGQGTTDRLSKLQVGVIGCSGTGSIVLECLARLGIKSFIIVDPDKVEDRNLNRIFNSKFSDIGRQKVDVLADAIRGMGLRIEVLPLAMNIFDTFAVKKIAECDVVFGCMDTAEGRQILNRIATFYVIPYFDLGVHLKSDGNGGISEASGVVHYLQPGGSSLLSRKAYTRERIRAENLYRTNPEAYKNEFRAGYIEGVDEKSPAVVSVNSTIVSIAVNEFLARVHPYRSCRSDDCAIIRFNFMETLTLREEANIPCTNLLRHVGRGDVNPILDMPSLSQEEFK